MPARTPHPNSPEGRPSARGQRPSTGWRWLKWLLGAAIASGLALLLALGIALAVAFPNLPDVTALADYRPKLPLRVLSADGETIAEFGEERRNLTPIEDIPPVMINAVLAIEDARFYEHSGIDYIGMLRAALANLGRAKSQGASTITMQVARNVYLSSEKSYQRKIYEVLLTFKLEALLSKDQILGIYMNQIFLGHRAYGFAAASQVYFGKPLKELTIAEAAMLAGLPKAPSAYNPITNPKRARIRQLYIIERMQENGFITAEQARAAKEEELVLKRDSGKQPLHAEYLAEMVRQVVYQQYGPETYTRGLTVHTTLDAQAQRAAYNALRRGVLDFERRQHYRGPEKFIELPADPRARTEAIDEVITSRPDNGELRTAVVLEAGPRRVLVVRGDDELIAITGDGLKPVQSGLSDKAPPNLRLRPGAVVRVVRNATGWELTQLPEVESAFVALDPRSGEIRALVGGFDFEKNKFNHVTQAWRQPGSSFKPFIYSAALEKGISPATVVNDGPLYFNAGVTGGQPWEPKNYDGKFEGPMTVRTALAKSKNMVSIRILQTVGAAEVQRWVTRFGFDADKHPPYLTMALGAGSVTPLQMAAGYGVFANGGHYAAPRFISRIDDHRGRVLQEFKPPAPEDMPQVIEPRNAFIMNQLLNEVARSGTAARAQATLKRPDLYGKTGTTNDAVDAWFVGYQPTLVGAVWVGYDNPRNLGSRETGGGLSLPIWINFMQEALRDTPVAELAVPPGVVNVQGEWYYDNYAPGSGVARLGGGEGEGESTSEEAPPPAESEEKRGILDLFKN
ncbi:penicillin-binding protein 1A [Malikia sp.]|uniref:penicillin-binding protein 1A n=1 Tax=Malikia sp. TaxID=2070706 RepID=UPI00260934DB|nr:penicillin-binding protein 1A [Malikia sp.]MDD2729215.1 penicillin-binding protein 1A [Malikia sp.]